MTFADYWEKNEPFGANPEDVAQLAWNAAIEQCAKIVESQTMNDVYPYGRHRDWQEISANIRQGAK